eukprot:9413844-Pyramimonas_sp.AAC.1
MATRTWAQALVRVAAQWARGARPRAHDLFVPLRHRPVGGSARAIKMMLSSSRVSRTGDRGAEEGGRGGFTRKRISIPELRVCSL